MANQHSKKLRGIRQIEDALWEELGKVAADLGTDRSDITRRFYEWFVGWPGAQLPDRPTPPKPTDPDG
jgi:hypothetical protein